VLKRNNGISFEGLCQLKLKGGNMSRYEELNEIIIEHIQDLSKDIDEFTSNSNTEYNEKYKNKLRLANTNLLIAIEGE